MTEHIVGMFWNRNEADLLPYTLERAAAAVDSLFIADDMSTDGSWDIIQSFATANPNKVEYTQRKPNKRDPAQRQALLNEIRKRYKPADTWVQIIESDMCTLDTNIREAIKTKAIGDIGITWHMLNAVRRPGEWESIDTYPNWTIPIPKLMPYGHWTEVLLYTFRPLPDLYYSPVWRPWPSGFSKYYTQPLKIYRKEPDSPLLSHYGFRGPTHFFNKYKSMGNFHRKYKTWDLSSPEKILETVPYFNGQWNSDIFSMSREGWIDWLRRRGVET